MTVGNAGRTLIAVSLAATIAVASSDELHAGAREIVTTTYTYKKVGDLELQADVHRTDDDRVLPVVMWIHGGALIGGNRTSFSSRVRTPLLEAGYAVVSIDYRLAPESKLPEIIEDVEDAYTWLHQKGPELFHVDTKKIVVMGGSAGGYLTLTAGFRAKPRPAALVAFWGYGDLIGDWYGKPDDFYRQRPLISKEDALANVGTEPLIDGSNRKRFDFYLYCRQNGLWPKLVSGFDHLTEPEAFDPYMPVRNVTADYPPTLLIHGTVDTDVPYEQSVLMEEQFKQHGVAYQFVSVEDAGHGLSGGDKQRVQRAYDQMIPFVKQYLPVD